MSQENLVLTFAKGEKIPTEGDTTYMKGLANEYEVKIHEIILATRNDDETLTLKVRATRTIAEPPPSIAQYWTSSAWEQSRMRR